MKKTKKEKEEKIDGLSPRDIKKLRSAIRQVWSWSTPKKLCIERATHKDGFPRCEKCKKKVPKVFADHLTPVGEFDEKYIQRMWVPSEGLQAICKKCHQAKTNEENRRKRFEAKIGL